MKVFKKLFLLSVTLLVGTLSAVVDTQKTELVLRDHRHRAMAFTTFHDLGIKNKENFGTKIQVTAFYHETEDSSELGEVFGANGKNYIKVGTQAQVNARTADVENNFLLHYHVNPAANPLAGTIKFNPEHVAYGTQIEAFICLDKIIKGLYFEENFSLMNVENKLNMTVCDGVSGAVGESHTLNDILTGKRLSRSPLGVSGDNNIQEELRYAKMRTSESRTGISNMESILGLRFFEKKRWYAGINLALISPSGDRPTGEYFWEPRLGSQHWALGAGAEGGWTFWKTGRNTFKLLAEFHYRYQFSEYEKRTLGIKNILTNAQRKHHILSHYYLLAERNQYTFIPAANALTKYVKVNPGSQIDTFAVLNYTYNGITADLGYNFYWREREKVHLNRCDWTDSKYGIAVFDVSAGTSSFFNVTTDIQPNNKTIDLCNVDTSVAETPEIMSHTIFGSLGYVFSG
jgi:hypothetical protein